MNNSNYQIKTLCFNTKYRKNRDTTQSHDCELYFPFDIKNILYLKLSSIELPNSYYVISKNNKSNNLGILLCEPIKYDKPISEGDIPQPNVKDDIRINDSVINYELTLKHNKYNKLAFINDITNLLYTSTKNDTKIIDMGYYDCTTFIDGITPETNEEINTTNTSNPIYNNTNITIINGVKGKGIVTVRHYYTNLMSFIFNNIGIMGLFANSSSIPIVDTDTNNLSNYNLDNIEILFENISYTGTNFFNKLNIELKKKLLINSGLNYPTTYTINIQRTYYNIQKKNVDIFKIQTDINVKFDINKGNTYTYIISLVDALTKNIIPYCKTKQGFIDFSKYNEIEININNTNSVNNIIDNKKIIINLPRKNMSIEEFLNEYSIALKNEFTTSNNDIIDSSIIINNKIDITMLRNYIKLNDNSVDVTEGIYAPDKFALMIQNTLNAYGNSGGEFKVEIEDGTFKTKVSHTGRNFRMFYRKDFIKNDGRYEQLQGDNSNSLLWTMGYREKYYGGGNYIVVDASDNPDTSENEGLITYTADDYYLYISEGIYNGENMNFYFLVDDGIVSGSKSNEIIIVQNDTYKSDNILTKIHMKGSILSIVFADPVNDGLQTRYYDQPVTIRRLKVKLIDDNLLPADLNNMDYSFSIEVGVLSKNAVA